MAGSAAIGVFDSGIGGLTVVRALRARLPGESIVYLGDTARFPYGTKSAETLVRVAREDAGFLLEQGVKLVVVACHSASAAALPDLRRRLRVPVVGVIEPGARALVAATRSRRVGVIGTSATVRSGAYQEAIRSIAPEVEVVARATPLFVALAEEGWLEGDVPEAAARHYLSGLGAEQVDALLLGCTHFPLLAPVIGRTVGGDVRLVDAAVETANAVAGVLAAAGLLSGAREPADRFYFTDLPPSFDALCLRFLGTLPSEVARASIVPASDGEFSGHYGQTG